jgi:hypothetical protein
MTRPTSTTNTHGAAVAASRIASVGTVSTFFLDATVRSTDTVMSGRSVAGGSGTRSRTSMLPRCRSTAGAMYVISASKT